MNLLSTSPSETVLAAIKEGTAEAGESGTPDELRRFGAVGLESRVRGRTFHLRYVRKAFWGEYDFLELEGVVQDAPDGGSHTVARCGKARGLWASVGALVALATVIWLSGGAGAGVILGMALVVLVLRGMQDHGVTRADSEAAYLAESLEKAVARTDRLAPAREPAG
jgi:hypothetical protein